MRKYKIADIVVEIDCEDRFIYPNLDLFQWNESEKSDFVWTLTDCEVPVIPESLNWISFSGYSVGRFKDKVYVSYPLEDAYQIRWIIYEDNFSKATFYYTKCSLKELPDQMAAKLAHYLFAFYREAFFLGILYRDGISIHSASLVYQKKGIVFSAMSQTGKSTHTNLWHQYYHTPILDGDVTVCRCLKEGNFIYGLPWCGTSGLFQNQKAELEAVVFLRQGPKNVVSGLSIYDAFQQLYARSFTPLWDQELVRQRVSVSEKILERIPQIYLLKCLPNLEAVKTIKDTIDMNWK